MKWHISNDNIFLLLIIGFAIVITLLLVAPITRVVTKLIKQSRYKTLGSTSKVRFVHQINEAVKELSATKTGALITIENKVVLEPYRTDGVILNANLTSQILLSIFQKNSPLHDGAVIVAGSKIQYAGTFYKITRSSIANKYGARHRAAIGVSEETDSTTIVVSEETGGISLVKNGIIKTIKLSKFQEELIKSVENNINNK